ncbi:MAG: hypothetical protein HIU89_15070 [Proteobacteria bacterium]|nr:hypothetical protein [Pseudomonadota bacterium]
MSISIESSFLEAQPPGYGSPHPACPMRFLKVMKTGSVHHGSALNLFALHLETQARKS